MAQSATFRRQHDTILALAQDLVAAQLAVRTPDDAARAARCLAKLTGVLQMHLAAEDKALYPRLKLSRDPEVAVMANSFMTEMGGLAEAYGEFEARWRSSSAIMADPAGFVEHTAAVMGALEIRIARENSELYPLLDAAEPVLRAAV